MSEQVNASELWAHSHSVTKRDDGGPAFPAQHFDLTAAEHGISVRDYFAAKAMQAVITKGVSGAEESVLQKAVAETAYAMADAMLKARSE